MVTAQEPARAAAAAELAWGLQRLSLQACWEQGITGAGVRVGHLDTGVDAAHPALKGRVAEFVEFDPNGFPAPGARPSDSGGHGTHIAGIICGGLCEDRIIGAAPGALLCAGMVIEGGKSLVRVLAGLDWMLDCRVRVLCLSLGLPVANPLYEPILARLRQAGVLVIAPAGNDGPGRVSSPARYAGVLAVGALDAGDQVARFSGSQRIKRAGDHYKPNLVAPGVNIQSAKPGGGLQTRSGTSMAAAHAAGAAALLFEARPSATPAEVEQALLSTCAPLPGGEERAGRGLIQPLLALDAILATRRSAA